METKRMGKNDPDIVQIFTLEASCGVTDCIGFNWVQDQAMLLMNLYIPSDLCNAVRHV
jgi:hypothetical protein